MTKTKLNPVILPLIRRVMPTIIANNIVGISPMVGPNANLKGMLMDIVVAGTTHIVTVSMNVHDHYYPSYELNDEELPPITMTEKEYALFLLKHA